MGDFSRETTLDIRTSLSIQDSPVGIPGATAPRPEDLQPAYEEYRYGPGDSLNFRIFELLAGNTETAIQATIDEIGTISLPVLGQVRVAGLTRNEMVQEISDQLIARGILQDPQIVIEPLVRRSQVYTIFGAAPQPNVYPLTRPDTKLLEAINIAGGLVDTVTEIFVIRNADSPEPTEADMEGMARRGPKPAARLTSGQPERTTTQTGERGVQAGIWASALDAAEQGQPMIGTQPAPDDPLLVSQEPITTTAATAPSTAPGDTQPSEFETTATPRWLYVNGEWVRADAADAETQPAVEEEPEQDRTKPPPERPAEPQVDWERVADDYESRVIRIAADRLREGDYRQNIIVRPNDTIRLLAGQVGEYYIMGQVLRPGAYSITGRKITLKAAIASAGNLAPLAWPDRCTIYRRYGDREEMHQVNLDAIFAGTESDVLLKNNDLILVGTHPIAPFLAVFRNAFRMTYGFGFVYDRNFADIDSFGAQINPANQPAGFGSNFPNLFN